MRGSVKTTNGTTGHHIRVGEGQAATRAAGAA